MIDTICHSDFRFEKCVHESRWHNQLSGVTYLEYADPQVQIAGFSNATAAYLRSLGYNITYEDTTGSTSHVIIRFTDGTLEAASDPRKVRDNEVL